MKIQVIVKFFRVRNTYAWSFDIKFGISIIDPPLCFNLIAIIRFLKLIKIYYIQGPKGTI